jgi:alpha-N-arabinofuranosidase
MSLTVGRNPGAETAGFVLDPAFGVGAVDPRLFGSFVEHLGRCVYTGIFEPGHPEAGADGLRADVLALVRELGVTLVRYPGGNFVSSYRWEDTVGPVASRPRRLDPAWRSIETNQFGLAEFLSFVDRVGAQPLLAVNLGTRGIAEALELLEYVNHAGGTTRSDLRIAHGRTDPFGVRLWCLGNEMDGPWQVGHRSAPEYGQLAAATARAMKLIDPDLELAVCGSSGRSMSTFGAWESTVLRHTYDSVDYLSMHAYYEERDGDRDSFLASAEDFESMISDVVATCDHVRARLRSTKTIHVSVDEWNVWYLSRPRGDEPPWREAPRLLEESYTVTDAVVVGSLLIGLLRHADRVRIACLAQLVNAIGPIMTEPSGSAWRQTTFWPFSHVARFARGRSLQVHVSGPGRSTATYGTVSVLHAAAILDDDSGALTVFAVNRNQTAPLALRVELRGLRPNALVEHVVVADSDPDARNTAIKPDRVTPRRLTGATLTSNVVEATLPPLSWNMIRLA